MKINLKKSVEPIVVGSVVAKSGGHFRVLGLHQNFYLAHHIIQGSKGVYELGKMRKKSVLVNDVKEQYYSLPTTNEFGLQEFDRSISNISEERAFEIFNEAITNLENN